MQKELKYLEVNYSEKDLAYIDTLVKNLEIRCSKVVDWFDMKEFGPKTIVTLFPDIKSFHQALLECSPKMKVYDWTSGYTCKNSGNFIVDTLSLEGLHETSHKDATYDDYENMLVHEFVHSCQLRIRNAPNVIWLTEGMACYFANQYSSNQRPVTTSLEEVFDNKNGQGKYSDYKKMFCYVYETYGRDYCLELLTNREKAYLETPRLYEEAVNYYKETLKR